MTREQYRKRKRFIRRLVRDVKFVSAWAILIALSLAVIVAGCVAGKMLYKWLVGSGSASGGEEITVEPIETPTPTPTQAPIEGLERRDPKEDHYLVLKIGSSYEADVKEVNVRTRPWKGSGLVTTIAVGETFEISCYYRDPDNSGFIGLNAGELGVPGSIVWVSKQYCKVSECLYPWAAHTYDYTYHKKYDQAKVTVRNLDGDTDPNVRSEPWESENSAYGRVYSGTVIRVTEVYVSDDQQWYGFPAGAFKDAVSFFDSIRKDPDQIVWIYQKYCVIDPQ